MPQFSLVQAREAALAIIEKRWPRLFLATIHHRSTRNTPLDFNNRLWLIPIYKDDHDKIVIQKSFQVGATDWALNELFCQACRGRAVMYILPTDVLVYEFTPRRIHKLIERVPYYRRNYMLGRKDSDTKKQITIFGVDCNIVGSNSEKNFFEKPVDVLIIDEMDLCVQNNLTFAYDRLGSSATDKGYAQTIWRKLGNPSIEGTGINEIFNNSKKCEWHIKCPHCNKWQTLDWFKNFVGQEESGQYFLLERHLPSGGNDATAHCRHCNKSINRLDKGEWIAEHPESDISGYHISKLFGDPRDGIINNLFEEFLKCQYNQSRLQHFYNQILGIPFTSQGTKLDETIMGKCVEDYKMPLSSTETIAGVDVGGVFHVNISEIKNGIRRKVYIGTALDWNDLQLLVHRYKITRGVIDAEPEHHGAREFVMRHPGWYVCYYNLPDTSKNEIEIDHVTRTIRTKRTASIDESLSHWLDGRIVIPKNWMTIDNGEFLKQMKAPTRVLVEDARGNKKYEWQEGGKPDHYFHADNYERIAATMFRQGCLIGTT